MMINENFWSEIALVNFLPHPLLIKSCKAGTRFRRRFLEKYHLVLVREGTGILKMNGIEYQAAPGMLFFLPHDSLVEAQAGEGKAVYFMLQTFTYIWKTKLDTPLFSKEGIIELGDSAPVMRGFEQLGELAKLEGPMVEWKRSIVFQELLYAIVTDLNAGKKQGGTRFAVEKAKAYLDKHYMEDISLSALANQYGISPSNFAGIFKKYTGVRPIDYLTHLRMEQAKPLSGVTNLGWQSETNFESILAAEPELILANDGMGKGFGPTAYSLMLDEAVKMLTTQK